MNTIKGRNCGLMLLLAFCGLITVPNIVFGTGLDAVVEGSYRAHLDSADANEKMIEVTIGATPTPKFWVDKEGDARFYGDVSVDGTLYICDIKPNDSCNIALTDDEGNGITVEDGGQVGIGTDTPSEALDVVGSMNITGTYKVDGTQISTTDLSNYTSIGMLNEAETITGNWVNTANPWADNEVADNLTLTGSTCDGVLKAVDTTGIGLQDSSSNNGLWVENGGQVGVRTTGPVATLDIQGKVGASGNPGETAETVLNIAGGTGGNGSGAPNACGGVGSAISIAAGTGGTSYYVGYGSGGDGGAIGITSGTGGYSYSGTGGDGGHIEITTGAGGDGEYGGQYGNVSLAKNGGNVGIGIAADSGNLNHAFEIHSGATYSEIAAGEASFTTSSSRDYKENITPLEAENILDKVLKVPVSTYDFRKDFYNGSEESRTDRLGLIAEDFHQVFGRGNDKEINSGEVQMALWLAVQELTKQNEKMRKELKELREELNK